MTTTQAKRIRQQQPERIKYGAPNGPRVTPTYNAGAKFRCSLPVFPERKRYSQVEHQTDHGPAPQAGSLSAADLTMIVAAIEQLDWVAWVRAQMASDAPAGTAGGEVVGDETAAPAEPDDGLSPPKLLEGHVRAERADYSLRALVGSDQQQTLRGGGPKPKGQDVVGYCLRHGLTYEAGLDALGVGQDGVGATTELAHYAKRDAPDFQQWSAFNDEQDHRRRVGERAVAIAMKEGVTYERALELLGA